MNYENNDSNNMEPSVAPVVPVEAQQNPVAEPAAMPVEQAPVVEAAPVVETPAVAEPAPVVEQAPVAEPVQVAEPAAMPMEQPPVMDPMGAPAEQTTIGGVEPVAAPTMMPGEVPPANPPMDGPMMSGTQPMPTEPEKKNNMTLIIAIVAAVVVIGGVGAFFLFGKSKDEEPTNTSTEENKTVDTTKQTEFLALVKQYVDAAKKMWDDETIVCQNPNNREKLEMLKPSALPNSSTNKQGEKTNVDYYIFFNTKDSTEINFGVSNTNDVAGWVRVRTDKDDKTKQTYYIALSDGTTYVVDKGYEKDFRASDLTVNDVHIDGDGNYYQYFDGEILGAANKGDGWRIGNSVVLKDNDDTNNSDFNSQGPKNGGYTPYCELAKK